MLLDLLKKYDYTIATIESITGGMLASKIVDIAGISKYYKGGYVAYSNELKNKIGVNKETILKYGAVSFEVAKEMLESLIKNIDVNIAISTTGMAGPTSDEYGKEVGLVYIGFYINGDIKVNKCNFRGTREEIRNNTVEFVLKELEKKLNNI